MTANRKWTILGAVGVVLVLVAGWFLLVSPKKSEAAELRDRATAQESQNDQLRLDIVRLRKQAAGVPEQKALLASIKKAIPDNPALPSLVRDLTSIAAGSNVKLVSLAPATAQAVTPAGSKPAAPAPAGKAAAPSGLFQIPVAITVEGSYFDVQRFLSGAEGLDRKMLVTTFTLAPGAKSGDKPATPVAGKSPVLTATINAQVFASPDLGTAAPTGPTKLPGASSTASAPAK